MKKLFLILSIAATIIICAAPLSVHAENLNSPYLKYDSNLKENSSNMKQIVTANYKEYNAELKNLLDKCKIGLIFIIQNGCQNAPNGDIVITLPSIPETTIPKETKPEETKPEETKPLPTTGGINPYITIPETQTAEASVPDTKAPVSTVPDTTLPDTKAPVPSVPAPALPDIQATLPNAQAPSVSETQPQESSETVHSYILRILELVNEERAKVGLNQVTLDTAASKAAQIRAKEIVSNFSHTRPNGSSCFTALSEQDVRYRTAGENIAWGQRTPEQVMEGWMNSSGHRANILNETFTHIGVGYHQQNGVNYWTQLFFQ